MLRVITAILFLLLPSLSLASPDPGSTLAVGWKGEVQL